MLSSGLRRGRLVLCALLLGMTPVLAAGEEAMVDESARPGLAAQGVYYERYRGNSFIGTSLRLGGAMDSARRVFFRAVMEARLGRARGGDGEYHRFVSLPLGLGLAYGLGRVRVYAEGGWDLLELIANDLLSSEEDAKAGNNAVDVDTFFGLGLEVPLKPRLDLDLRARYNAVSGTSIRDHARWYGGLGVIYRY